MVTVVKKITFLDKGFWLTETDNNPKHVASLQLLELPENADEEYLKRFFGELQQYTNAAEPFNCVVKSFLGFPTRLEPETKIDINYHVQHHLIDNVNDRAQLHKLIARFHESRLAVDKPLWQFHLIEGKTGRDFAIYIKIHHMYGDGATLVRWFQAAYKDHIDREGFKPVWAIETSKKRKSKSPSIGGFFSSILNFLIALKDFIWVLFRVLLKALRVNTAYMPVPFTGTKTLLTGQVKKGRALTTTDLSFPEVQALSKRLRASVNEILLCCFDIGIHRFLAEFGQNFDKALFTNMPINLRKPGDHSSGNKIAIVPVELAHGEKDPYLRLRQIIENHRIVVRAAKKSHPASFSYYTVFIQSIALVFELLRISGWFRPIANILISNMPGPKEERYLKDCKLKAVYPISTITPGGGVNITLLTYGATANIGIVCCNKEVESLEHLPQYFQEAFELLQRSVEDTSLNIDDIGETIKDKDASRIVEVPHYHHDEHKNSNNTDK